MPISLLVTTEMVRFIQAIFISFDEKMYTEKADTYCEVNSSNLNEELGQVSYVFSDKTGTLTCNEMIFKKAVIDGVAYGDKIDIQCTASLPKVSHVDFHDPDFFKSLADQKIR